MFNKSVSNPRNIISSATEAINTELIRLHKVKSPELVMFNDNKKCKIHSINGFSDAPKPIHLNKITKDGRFILILVTPSWLKTYIMAVANMIAMQAYAAGDVSGAIQSTWNDAKSQIKSIVNNVVFPVLDVVLVILLFVKIGTLYMECAPVKAIY